MLRIARVLMTKPLKSTTDVECALVVLVRWTTRGDCNVHDVLRERHFLPISLVTPHDNPLPRGQSITTYSRPIVGSLTSRLRVRGEERRFVVPAYVRAAKTGRDACESCPLTLDWLTDCCADRRRMSSRQVSVSFARCRLEERRTERD